MKKILSIFSLIFSCFFFGCATTYLTRYETHLLNSDPKTLHFKDDKFEFSFEPVPNGIYFMIKNLTDDPAILDWDRSYFIEPNGNSSKLLNVDLIEENSETASKAKYESILPPGADFGRFTTSALRVAKFIKVDSRYFTIGNMTFHHTNMNTFYNYGRYWPEKYSGTQIETYKRIKDYVLNNNKMGVGFSIKTKDTVLNYKFDFRIHKVSVFKTDRKENRPRKTSLFSMSDTNNWDMVREGTIRIGKGIDAAGYRKIVVEYDIDTYNKMIALGVGKEINIVVRMSPDRIQGTLEPMNDNEFNKLPLDNSWYLLDNQGLRFKIIEKEKAENIITLKVRGQHKWVQE
jgi:hypothetical protein